jgi:nuclease S1
VNKVRLQNRFLCFILSLCLIGISPAYACAWGPKGHRIIAQLAWAYLSPNDQQQIKDLLAGEDFVAASTLADEIPRSRKEMAWHYVSIPLGETFDDHRDCKGDDCVVDRIEHFTKELSDPSHSSEKRLEALKYLIHFVGDIHQPLHCAENGDNGGNSRQVTFFGISTNLHKVWDTDMIERTELSEGRYVDTLAARGYDISYLNGPVDWANESNGVAATYAYSQLGKSALGLSYYQYCLPALDLQLARAGIRLKLLLEGALNTARQRPASRRRRR